MQDTTFFAVIMDTSIPGFPAQGAEQLLYVAKLGDTLETASILRFDSLPKLFRAPSASEDSTIVVVDTGAYLRLFIATGDTLADSTHIEVYNVDLGGDEDSFPNLVTSAFTPDRLLATRTVPADSMRDSVRIAMDPTFILQRIQDPLSRMRLGIRVRQDGNPRLSIRTTNSGNSPTLTFRPSLDTNVQKMFVEPLSKAPVAEPFTASDFADYLVVLDGPPPTPADVFRVGGLPPRRAYLRFEIPKSILDSSNVVRATLFLTQTPSPSPEPTDTVGLGHFGVVSGPAITDLNRALLFLQRGSNLDTIRVSPADSAERSFEMIDWVRAWRNTDPLKTPRAIALATSEEGENGRIVDFFSIEAPVEVRPRLRLTYIPRRPPLP